MRLFLVTFLMVFCPSALAVEPVTTQLDRWELDWGNQKVRFFGETIVEQEGEQAGLDQAAKRAWQDGVQYLHNSLNQTVSKIQGQDVKVAAGLAGKLTSYNTIYYADGKVRVFLETKLPEVFASSTGNTEVKGGNPVHTAVVFQLDKGRDPSAEYVIKDETGAVLFSKGDVAQSYFEKNLMGRWYRGKSNRLPSNLVGSLPKVVAVRTSPNGELLISRASWKEIMQSDQALLSKGQIILLQPE